MNTLTVLHPAAVITLIGLFYFLTLALVAYTVNRLTSTRIKFKLSLMNLEIKNEPEQR